MDKVVYALKQWSLRRSGTEWFVSPTAFFEKKPEWKGPYQTLRRATLAIARKLEEEAHRRDKK